MMEPGDLIRCAGGRLAILIAINPASRCVDCLLMTGRLIVDPLGDCGPFDVARWPAVDWLGCASLDQTRKSFRDRYIGLRFDYYPEGVANAAFEKHRFRLPHGSIPRFGKGDD